MIINLYNIKQNENPNRTYKELIALLSHESGIGTHTVVKTLSEYKNKGTITSISKITRIKKNAIDKIDNFQKSALRCKIHEFWFKGEVPTLKKIQLSINEDPKLPNLKRTTLYRVLKDLNFEYTKTKDHTNFVLIERDNIVKWRRNYLKSIQNYREEKRPIYFLGETQFNIGKNKNKKQLVVFHIGSTEGFVLGGLHYFESSTKNIDDYNEKISDHFFTWFKNILPLLKDNAVIIMETMFYHSIKEEEIPLQSWKKEQIVKWLKSKNEIFDKSMSKDRLMDIVKQISPQFNKYVIDEYVIQFDKTVVRLPPHHSELNPINLAWKMVKDYVKTNKVMLQQSDMSKLLLEGIEKVSATDWAQFVNQTEEEEENKFWGIDLTS